MILQHIERYRTFVLCCGSNSSSTGCEIEQPNTKPGEYNQYLYGLTGSGSVRLKDGPNTSLPLQTGVLTDLTEFIGQPVIFKSDGVAGWVGFNPFLANTKLDIQILNTPQTLSHQDTRDLYILPITGTATVNDKTLKQFECGRLFAGKNGSITIPDDSTVALVKTLPIA